MFSTSVALRSQTCQSPLMTLDVNCSLFNGLIYVNCTSNRTLCRKYCCIIFNTFICFKLINRLPQRVFEVHTIYITWYIPFCFIRIKHEKFEYLRQKRVKSNQHYEQTNSNNNFITNYFPNAVQLLISSIKALDLICPSIVRISINSDIDLLQGSL